MNPTNKFYLSLISFLLAASALFAFVVFPAFKSIQKSSQELISQKEKLASMVSSIENLEGFITVSENLGEFLNKVDNLFVRAELPIAFIRFLEKTAAESRLEVDIALAGDKEAEKDSWPFLVFQITAKGSFSNLLAFLEKLENSPYLIEINNLNVNKLKDSDNVQAQFTIKVYTK